MYSIHPICCGALTAPKSSLTYRIDRGRTFTFPVFSFLVLPADPDTDSVVLVDTGLKGTDSEYMRRRGRTVGAPGGGPEPLCAGLDHHGVTPDDIDMVVLTHLHHDHAANIDLFSNAEFVVQRKEVVAARNPLPIVANAYIEGTVERLHEYELLLIDGDAQLRKGIELLFTPGHTEGMQSVVVETMDGPYALIADLAYNQHNLAPSTSSIPDADGRMQAVTSMDIDYIPPGTHISILDCYESIAKVRARVDNVSDRLLSSHDAEVVDVPG
ncbi:N-acyl homoserine lactonase family protein [Halegenticoccus tardaugens]|uniref:N-acyl homoserine lactonase family protein n=1 Tax=Halegenticoccus tardaugens TaxID=2071624 RepID=UPI0013E8FFDD|nr:N-acyl homoserine lactonase family protein [Halegenticoccus tardaugens]